jgi:transcriptional regulator with XRE-family HTH domain
LKSLREARGLSLSTAADELDMSHSKLIRIENGSVGVSVSDVRALLGLYKAPEKVVDDLVALARAARERPWWHRYRDVIPAPLQEFMGFEADATHLRQFHTALVPGLLQIEPYFRALGPRLTLLNPTSDERYETMVKVRLRRQKEILHGPHPPAFTAIVDEGALHRQVGGPDAMRAQLLHLAEMQGHGHVSIGIIPFHAGAHFGMMGSFHLMDFPDDADAPLLYIENAQSSVFLQDNQELVAQYKVRFEELLSMSVRGQDAVAFLHKLC